MFSVVQFNQMILLFLHCSSDALLCAYLFENFDLISNFFFIKIMVHCFAGEYRGSKNAVSV